MEPLRGGKLAKLPEKFTEKLNTLRPQVNEVEWSFRYLQTFENMPVILSGTSDINQLKENIAIFEEEKPLTVKEVYTLYNIAKELTNTVPCTACRYCTDNCPMGLDIPEIIRLYNEFLFAGMNYQIKTAVEAMGEKGPQACIGCQACEAVCPQNIKISEIMSDFAENLNSTK